MEKVHNNMARLYNIQLVLGPHCTTKLELTRIGQEGLLTENNNEYTNLK